MIVCGTQIPYNLRYVNVNETTVKQLLIEQLLLGGVKSSVMLLVGEYSIKNSNSI